MSEKRENHAGKITIPVEVEVKFKTVKREEEFVSMTAYEMLANAFEAAMDEITMLRGKLARIQELIKE
jgi:hypothetical protein|nr:MAG TPA: hypothetical protein [Caudoviricetes sp.]